MNMLESMINSGLLGQGYQMPTGRPMLGGQQQNMNQPGGLSFARVPQHGNWLTGYDPTVMTSSPFTGNQQNLMNMLAQMSMQAMQGGQMPGGLSFDPIRKQAETQFQTQTIPSLAERFTAMGGGQRSSAFQGALGQAGAGLHENLAAMESQYKSQMFPMLLNMMNMGLRPQYEQQYIQGRPGFGQTIAGAAGQALPFAAMAFL